MKIIYSFIFSTIFLQQVLVINIGSSFKIYEFFSVVFVIFFLSNFRINSKESMLLFIFFVVLPFISLFTFPFYFDNQYYAKFPESLDIIRFDVKYSGFLIFFYTLLAFCTYNHISNSKYVYLNRYKLAKIYIIGSTAALTYSFYALLIYFYGLPDLVPAIIDFRNSKPTEQFRFTGFSSEPGTFIYSVAWSVIILINMENLFSRRLKSFLILYSLFGLILTMSSQLIIVMIAILWNYFMLKKYSSKKIIIFSSCTFLFFYLLFLNEEYSFIKYILFDKVSDFITAPSHTLSSGSFRAYTSLIGYDIFSNYPVIGVGAGNSVYFMFQHEFTQGIVSWGESLTATTYPQNSHAKILAEYGAAGYLIFALFFGYLIHKFYASISNSFGRIGFFGVFMTLFMFFSVYPEYSLFIWIPIAFTTSCVRFDSHL